MFRIQSNLECIIGLLVYYFIIFGCLCLYMFIYDYYIGYVTLGLDVVYSTLEEVKSGVSLFGNMTKTGDEEWYIAAIDESTNVNSDITVSKSRLSTQPWSYVTLEVYDVFECDQYPTIGTPIPYTQLKLYLNNEPTDPTWEIGTDGQNPPICSSNITIIDPNTVTITF